MLSLVAIWRVAFHGELAALLIISFPFLTDGLLSACRLTESPPDNGLRESLLLREDRREAGDAVPPTALQAFTHSFCVESPLKSGIFLLPSAYHFETQVTVMTLVLLELYTSLLSAWHSGYTYLSLAAVLVSLASIASYLTGAASYAASPLVATKLAALALGCLFDAFCESQIDGYFAAMTLVLATDACLSYASCL